MSQKLQSPVLVNRALDEAWRLIGDCDSILYKEDLTEVTPDELREIKWKMKEALGAIHGVRQSLGFL